MIKVRNLNKSYTGEPCLHNISLDIQRGEFVSVMGESGSGKTTLLEILAGVRSADSGDVTVCGEDISKMTDSALSKFRRTRLGVVYQTFGLIPTLTSLENIILPLILNSIPRKEANLRAEKIAKRLNIDGILSKYPSELSGGQAQRVAIARAVIFEPEVLLLDEPTGSLDSVNTKNVMDFLFEFNRELGCTILQITHSSKAAEGTRIIRIKDGAVEE